MNFKNWKDVARYWSMISQTVRAAVMSGNYTWVSSFGKAFYSLKKENFTEETLKGKTIFAVEPMDSVVGGPDDIDMLLFLDDGHVYEAKLLDASGRVRIMWLHFADFKSRPIVSIPDIRPKFWLKNSQTTEESPAPEKRVTKRRHATPEIGGQVQSTSATAAPAETVAETLSTQEREMLETLAKMKGGI